MSEFPRRGRIDLFTPAERAIYNAVVEVEKAGADIRLTDAVVLLQRAREAVADHADGVPRRDPDAELATLRAENTKLNEELGRLRKENGRLRGESCGSPGCVQSRRVQRRLEALAAPGDAKGTSK